MRLFLFVACAFAFLLSSVEAVSSSKTKPDSRKVVFQSSGRPVVMLTGYWSPTNEMVRPFSQNSKQNPKGWMGENWESRGYDIVSFFPEFPDENLGEGEGDFRVDFKATRNDLARITAKVHPIALVSFGRGAGPWEVEVNFPNFWKKSGKTLHASLPADEIAEAVNETGALRAWVDRDGNPGSYLCGYLSFLGAQYHEKHLLKDDPAQNLAQGFIHVGDGFSPEQYTTALQATLRALIKKLDQDLKP